VGTCAFCEADIQEGGGTQIVGTDYRICDKCLADVEDATDARAMIDVVMCYDRLGQVTRLLVAAETKRQAARDDAAPADSPTGERVDR